MKEFTLVNSDKTFIVDDCDYKRLLKFKFYLAKTHIYSTEGFKVSRFLFNFPQGKIIDHADGNPFDNRRSNLRVCTKAENNRNSKKKKKNASSKFKGVCWNKNRKQYGAKICLDYKQINLGFYDSEVVAAKVYDRYSKKYHKDFSSLNSYTLQEEKEWNKVKDIYDKDFVSYKKKSKFFGVGFRAKGKNRLATDRWRSFFVVKDRRINCGQFDTELEASLAYNIFVEKLQVKKPLNVYTKKEQETIDVLLQNDVFWGKLNKNLLKYVN